MQKAINSQNTLPILGNILFTIEGQKLTLSATNLEIFIQISLPANIKNEGSITVSSRIITNWTSFLKPGDIEIKTEDNDSISLKTKEAKTKIKCVSAEEFPSLPIINKENEISLPIDDFQKSINEVSFSCAHSTIRPVLSGILLQGKGSEVQLVATDSYRLSEKKIKLKDKIDKEIYCIIPARTMIELERILSTIKEKNKEIKIITSQNQILFQIDNITVISRLIEGKFPEHTQIIPKTEKTQVVINKDDFILAIKRVGIFAKENNNNIKLFFETDKTIITTDATEIGLEEAEITIQLTGEKNQTAVNGQFLLDVLSVIEDNEVVIKVAEKLSPIIIHGKNQNNFVHVIMPLKL